MIRTLFATILLLFPLLLIAQKQPATVSGRVIDELEKPLAGVSVVILGRETGATTNDSGRFTLRVPAGKPLALTFSMSGYVPAQRNFFLNEKETETVVVRLEKSTKALQEVIISGQPDRQETGLIRINAQNALVIPSTIGGIESLIKIFVGSNNELTSQYSVRGGNFDENLVYVNDFEIFRPYLTRSGQQEGLSFINPELTGKVSFYTGGFQARYGDKMSSVLDIQYKRPVRQGGSVYISLLEQGAHLEGRSKNETFSWIIGARNRSNRNLLAAQETKGSYIPISSDLQGFFTWQPGKKWQFDAFVNLSATRFSLSPEFSQLTSSVFSPLFSANIGVDIYFEGREEDRYATNMIGFSATRQVSKNLKLKWMVSRFLNQESEQYDILGGYIFGERDFDRSKPSFGSIVNPLGAGVYQQFARNNLTIGNWSAAHKGQWSRQQHAVSWGLTAEQTGIRDDLQEWERQDSAGYTLPYNRDALLLSRVVRSQSNLDITKLSGYIQDNFRLTDSGGLTLSAGMRFHYNNLNRQWLLSPRVQLAWQPFANRNIVWKAAAGAYHQPPFYRELRAYDGRLNTAVRAQRSWQFVTAADYQFRAWGRPFRLSTEAYYKTMRDIVPYDLDNVRLRYFGQNNARAYATGIEMRLSGEWVKDAESWISLGFMRTREDLQGDFYQQYFNKSGERITRNTQDQEVADSVRTDIGWLRRPTDRLLTFGMFFQDYLSTNKNVKVHLNMLVGSNMPYNIPGSMRYRNALIIDPYIRADIGFSVLLLDSEKTMRRSHSPFRNLENIWMSFEVFNLLDRRNTISYMLIKDFSNTVFALPNRLTPRLVNIKLLTRF